MVVAGETMARLEWKGNREILLWFGEQFSLLYMEQENRLEKNGSAGVHKGESAIFVLPSAKA